MDYFALNNAMVIGLLGVRRRGMNAAIQIEDLTLCYRKHPAVHHVTGIFPAGQATAIIGPNGAGKSTLLKGLAGLMTPDHGNIQIAPSATLAYLPQLSQVDRNFPMSVFEFAASGLWAKIGNTQKLDTVGKNTVMAALKTVGLVDFVDRNLDTLSGGQMQRVLFARLIVQDARVILLDEPFTAIDARTTADLILLMRQWLIEKRTVIAVLHDMHQVQAYFSYCVLLARELVAWGKTEEVLTGINWQKADALAEGWLNDAPVCQVEGAQI
jgi:zinc/manganese transport system ATP-binding protein